MNKELTKWFKENCKDVGHLNYGKIKEIIEKQETEKEIGDRKLNALMRKHFIIYGDGSMNRKRIPLSAID